MSEHLALQDDFVARVRQVALARGVNAAAVDEFCEQLASRLVVGEREYGDRSLELEPVRILEELGEELVDVVGWSFVLWFRVRRRQRLEARLADLEAFVATLRSVLRRRGHHAPHSVVNELTQALDVLDAASQPVDTAPAPAAQEAGS